MEGVFANDPLTRVITKEEALKILQEAEESGLIHSSANIREGHMILCNCCTCCCGMLRGISQLGIKDSIAQSDFYAIVDSNKCNGSENCVKRCEFGALSIREGISYVDHERCVGCGQCVLACPTEAIAMARKPEDQITSTPRNMQEWMMERAKNRGISLGEVI
jgi:NAD-dependent dihydropyrimidine dehydrogenase PreA subunit